MRRGLLAVITLVSTFGTVFADESWIAIATGSNSDWVYAYLRRAPTKERAETNAMNDCKAAGRTCTYLKGWNRGCVHAVTGHDEDGRVYLGIGPTLASAIQKCEEAGATCADPEPASICVLEQKSAPTGEAAVPMAQIPGTTVPTDRYRAVPRASGGSGDLVSYFRWVYKFQPEPGMRTWSRDATNRWSEQYPSGRVAKVFDVVEASSSDGCNGQLVRDSSDPGFEVFIPNLGCNKMVAKFRRDGGNWSPLGAMQDVR